MSEITLDILETRIILIEKQTSGVLDEVHFPAIAGV